jgi:hypothetical protein
MGEVPYKPPQRQGELLYKRGDGENLLFLGFLGVLNRIDDLDLVSSSEMLLAYLLLYSRSPSKTWAFAREHTSAEHRFACRHLRAPFQSPRSKP